jgi:hypothetical protein
MAFESDPNDCKIKYFFKYSFNFTTEKNYTRFENTQFSEQMWICVALAGANTALPISERDKSLKSTVK